MLHTARLTLRAARPGDLADLHAVYGDARTMRYWSTAPHAGLMETKRWLEGLIAASGDTPPYLVIEHEGRAIGTAGVHEGAEIGFILHADYWRRGLMREAFEALIPYLFEVTGAETLTADADPRNTASIALMAALGFEETGRAERTFCVNGEWSDSVYLRLTRPWAPSLRRKIDFNGPRSAPGAFP
ncbi:MAG: GNAT family N-acetyltransferase [Pseudomonadota bacterium]